MIVYAYSYIIYRYISYIPHQNQYMQLFYEGGSSERGSGSQHCEDCGSSADDHVKQVCYLATGQKQEVVGQGCHQSWEQCGAPQ